jgi:hypothetical protein
LIVFERHSECDAWLEEMANTVKQYPRLSSYFTRMNSSSKRLHPGYWDDVSRTGKLDNHMKKLEGKNYLHLTYALVGQIAVKLNIPLDNAREYCLDEIVREASLDKQEEFEEKLAKIREHTLDSMFTLGKNNKPLIPEGSLFGKLANVPYSAFEMDSTLLSNISKEAARANLGVGTKLTNIVSVSCAINPSHSNGFSINPVNKEVFNMKITRPINVSSSTFGIVDVLTASESILASLVREAQKEIDANDDLALISKSYAKKAEELQKIIELCVKQIDKVAK